MKTFLKKYWVLLIFLFTAIAVALLLLIGGGAGTPVASPSPTPKLFVLEHVFPPPGKREMGDSGIALAFSFSSPIEMSSTIVTLKPYISFDLFTDKEGKTLYIKPLPKWNYNVEYKINISLKSKDGRELDSPIEQVFMFTPMKNSPLSE